MRIPPGADASALRTISGDVLSCDNCVVTDRDMEMTYRRITLRLMPLLFISFVFNYIDRINIGYAQLQMKPDVGFTDTVYGIGASTFYVGYLMFEIPSNLAMERMGARKTLLRIMLL